MDTWVASTFWLLWISMYSYLLAAFSSLGIYLEVEIMDHMVILLKFFKKPP